MEKRYEGLEIIKIVDRAFTNFEKELSSRGEKLGKKVSDDSHFGTMLSMMKFAIMAEILSILKEGE